MVYSRKELQQAAILISAFSILYNAVEGVVSVYLGEASNSFSLFFFGIQSFIEVLSATLVLWRFTALVPPGEETRIRLSSSDLYREKVATISIGSFFLALSVGTVVTVSVKLSRHDHPDDSNYTLIVSSTCLVIMILVWLPKPWLARELNSSAMRGEAKCSLSCIQLTLALFIGSIIYKFWPEGWWVDSAISLVLAIFFFKEGYEALAWGTSKAFTGGCCHDCTAEYDPEVGTGEMDGCSKGGCSVGKEDGCNKGGCSVGKEDGY